MQHNPILIHALILILIKHFIVILMLMVTTSHGRASCWRHTAFMLLELSQTPEYIDVSILLVENLLKHLPPFISSKCGTFPWFHWLRR